MRGRGGGKGEVIRRAREPRDSANVHLVMLGFSRTASAIAPLFLCVPQGSAVLTLTIPWSVTQRNHRENLTNV